MESRDFITVSRPPADVFEQSTVDLQEGEGDGVQGELFDRMDYPEEGGIYAYFYDHAHPTKGQPYPQAVDAIQVPKKLIMGTAKFIKRHFLLSAFIFILPNFLTRSVFRSLIRFFLHDNIMATLKPYCFLAENRYCNSMREVRRAGFKVIKDQKLDPDFKELLETGLITFTNILEWDNAHRYRFQDILPELNKAEFLKNPGKEIARLAMVQVSRERGWYDDKGRWPIMGKALGLALFFSPFLKNLAKAFIREVDLEKVKLDEADEYHNFVRPDYDIHGWPIEVRQKMYLKAITQYRQSNPQRIEEGSRQRQRAESAAQVQLHMQREKGVPYILFFVVPKGDGISQVKMMETKFSLDNPKLKAAALEIIQGKGKTGEDLEQEYEKLKSEKTTNSGTARQT